MQVDDMRLDLLGLISEQSELFYREISSFTSPNSSLGQRDLSEDVSRFIESNIPDSYEGLCDWAKSNEANIDEFLLDVEGHIGIENILIGAYEELVTFSIKNDINILARLFILNDFDKLGIQEIESYVFDNKDINFADTYEEIQKISDECVKELS